MIREREGCDVPQELGRPFRPKEAGYPNAYARFTISCSACSGRSPNCPVCDGSGEEGIYRCAGSLMSGDIGDVMRAYSAYEAGHLPDDGGMQDQAAPFVDAVHAISSEIARIRNEEAKLARAKAAQRGKGKTGRTANRL